jgi:hypothetical protein
MSLLDLASAGGLYGRYDRLGLMAEPATKSSIREDKRG